MINRNALSIRNTAIFAGAIAAASFSIPTAGAQTITTLVKAGKDIPGIGTVTGVDGYAVNNNGDWLVDADTDNADTNADRVLLKTGVNYWRENDPFAGLMISSWDDLNLTNAGEPAGNLFLRPTGAGDSAVHFNQNLVLQEGTISSATQFSANTPYIGFFGTKTNDNQQMIVMSSVDDPNISSTVDRALVQWKMSPTGTLLSEDVIVKEGDVLPGSRMAVADLETDSNEFDFANNGHAIFGADLTGTSLDSGVYRFDGTSVNLVALEGENSPAAGRTWQNLASAKVSISGNGSHYAHTGTLSGDTATDSVIVVDGAIYRQEGDSVPGIPGFQFTSFGTLGAQVDDSGNVLWYGDWNDPATAMDTGIFLNDQLLVQEGVTMIDGLTVLTVRSFADTLVMSDNGQYIVFEAVLTGNIEGAFMIAVPEPASATALVGIGFMTAMRRRRR